MAELVVKKWQLGRVLTAKNTEKAAFYVSKPTFHISKPAFHVPKASFYVSKASFYVSKAASKRITAHR